jgi:hypothetical protein
MKIQEFGSHNLLSKNELKSNMQHKKLQNGGLKKLTLTQQMANIQSRAYNQYIV